MHQEVWKEENDSRSWVSKLREKQVQILSAGSQVSHRDTQPAGNSQPTCNKQVPNT